MGTGALPNNIMTKINKHKKLTDQEREAYALVGRHGGRANFKKHGKKHMSSIGKRGAQKRWSEQSNSKSKN